MIEKSRELQLKVDALMIGRMLKNLAKKVRVLHQYGFMLDLSLGESQSSNPLLSSGTSQPALYL